MDIETFESPLLTTTVGVIKNETLVFVNFSAQDASILKFGKRCKSAVFWNPQDLLLMMGTEIFKFMHPRLRN